MGNGEEETPSGMAAPKATGEKFGKTELALLNLIAEIIVEIIMRNDDE